MTVAGAIRETHFQIERQDGSQVEITKVLSDPDKNSNNVLPGAISCSGICRKLSVCNRKTNGADMICNYTKCNILFPVVGGRVFFAGYFGNQGNGSAENIR